MAPFKHLLSLKSKFAWSTFQSSKTHIIDAIKKGVEIFDLQRNWVLLIPKTLRLHLWKNTLAGSRFLKPTVTRYAPVEGEALAIA